MNTSIKENVKYKNSWHKTFRKYGIVYKQKNKKII